MKLINLLEFTRAQLIDKIKEELIALVPKEKANINNYFKKWEVEDVPRRVRAGRPEAREARGVDKRGSGHGAGVGISIEQLSEM